MFSLSIELDQMYIKKSDTEFEICWQNLIVKILAILSFLTPQIQIAVMLVFGWNINV